MSAQRSDRPLSRQPGAPGSYKLYVQPNKSGYADQWFGGPDEGSATVIAVSANTLQDIALIGP
jgi:hypothetical protein